MTLLQKDIEGTFAAPAKIVVATDLTDTEYLLPHAIAQAKAGGASILLVHAVLPHESMPVETGAIPYYDPLRMDRDARLMLDGLARDIRAQGVECVAAVRHGFVPDIVAEVVRNSGAGRLILGTHGRRGLKKFVLGSVARQLLETVEIPVCTVGPRAHKRTSDSPMTILHPVSLAGMHATSADLSISLGEQFGAQVILLHVIMPGPAVARHVGEALTVATAALEQLVPDHARGFTQVQAKIALGSVVQEILTAAHESQAGLIVLGVHAPAHSWLPGTEPAAYKILVSAPCPVISLRVNAALSEEKQEQKERANPLVFG
ncbi:MAG TPA: universal stress protein [Acidobacteriaceae bacterium]|jgi:nucleotide-binding universal stress UspA family protein|nr:universal stress protein [Acidobacteriaceae bacterium]